MASHDLMCAGQQDCTCHLNGSDDLYTRLESAALVLPRSCQSLENGEYREVDQEKDKMQPFPRFALFVTAPGDEEQLP